MDKIYTSSNPFVKHIHLRRLEIISELVGYDDKELVLDCGCGEGHLLQRLSGVKFGVDRSDIALERARVRNPSARFSSADITQLPFEDGFFGIVTCSEVLEHVPDYRNAISEILRVTKPGGRMIISVPNERNWTIGRLFMLRFPPKIEDHVNNFKREDLAEAFGFEPKRTIYVPLSLTYQLALTQIFEFEKPI